MCPKYVIKVVHDQNFRLYVPKKSDKYSTSKAKKNHGHHAKATSQGEFLRHLCKTHTSHMLEFSLLKKKSKPQNNTSSTDSQSSNPCITRSTIIFILFAVFVTVPTIVVAFGWCRLA